MNTTPKPSVKRGIDYGIERGIERGMEQGRDIGHEDVAKNLLAMNFSTSDIIAATGLTAEQIRKLAETAD